MMVQNNIFLRKILKELDPCYLDQKIKISVSNYKFQFNISIININNVVFYN